MSDAAFDEAAVVAAIANELKISPAALDLESKWGEDYDLDSLEQVRLVMAVEDAAGVRIEDKLAVQARSVGALVELARRSPRIGKAS
ncbi:MAG TPA: acyl carrier protein [Dongiaceae bacterium]|jgi:acyl carrier protein|nr:acyl carrier protein [Dongiaceae bacterium]